MLEIANGGDNIKTINLGLILGDKSGYLHIQNKQKFYVEFDAYSVLRSSPPSNFIVRNGGELWLSADIRLIGNQIPALDLDGHLAGVMNLTLDEERIVHVADTASNSTTYSKKKKVKSKLLFFFYYFSSFFILCNES
jgi:hypothetical protein